MTRSDGGGIGGLSNDDGDDGAIVAMVETMVAMVAMMVVMVATMWRRAEEPLSVLGPGIDWALFRLLSGREALGAESEEPVSVGNDRNRLGSAATVGMALEGSCGVGIVSARA